MKIATWRSRFSDEEVGEISENSGSKSEVETDSTYYSSASDDGFDETSSHPASSPFYGEFWRAGNFRPNKWTFISTNSGYTSIVLQKSKGDAPMDFLICFLMKTW